METSMSNTVAEQVLSSKGTSINKNKLPAIAKMVNWSEFEGLKVLDVGCGRYSNLKEYVESFGVQYFGYDKYWKTAQENALALQCQPDIVISSNVLNVIDSDAVVEQVCELIQSYNVPYMVTVYAGDSKSIGRATSGDSYQRNQPLREYLRYFKNAKVSKGAIVG